jgi:hypothetical protein
MWHLRGKPSIHEGCTRNPRIKTPTPFYSCKVQHGIPLFTNLPHTPTFTAQGELFRCSMGCSLSTVNVPSPEVDHIMQDSTQERRQAATCTVPMSPPTQSDSELSSTVPLIRSRTQTLSTDQQTDINEDPNHRNRSASEPQRARSRKQSSYQDPRTRARSAELQNKRRRSGPRYTNPSENDAWLD